ncbi:aminodeoxychorismate lyase [Prosthecochloris sp. GSB1]|uniref:endolytic transglycosylase MltG n=1 Tax=Prosthecochloris sp. GSB1 TaxID=281093 RepID=UPI000B8CE7BE|nr:endolytic transglycosylase MltG [Prosthecochloris sp. GSB1]ASQ91510.1 aminodeoxychorismate lyase [Prosthecochloris sp. GSB1]
MPEKTATRPLSFTVGVVILLLIFLATFFFVPGWNVNPEGLGQKKIVVHRGDGLRRIVRSIRKTGGARYETPLLVTAYLFPGLRNIKPGRYTIPPGHSNYSLLAYLHGHPQDEERITIPEGLRKERVAAIVSSRLDIDSLSFMRAATDSALLSSLDLQANGIEGYLFPGTYNFAWASTPEEVITFLVGRYRTFLTDSLRALARKQGLNEHDMLTLASIVEAETPLDGEKPLIAGVYLNRLKKNMRLQADPTVQYALGGANPRRLLYKDLAIDSPYNTYRHGGLPPGPIGSPGALAILAVLKPEKTSYLYFVADGKGGHRFARTISEHASNVRQYRHARREAEEKARRAVSPGQ